uniref:HMA domain-containing protein n=1 Tax=Cucumis melo TaxID=3656 RepID=A0A9I9D708_CUCME
MAFLRSTATTTSFAVAAASALPAAFIFTGPSSSSLPFHFPQSFKPISLSLYSPPFPTSNSFGFVRNFAPPPSAVRMETPTSESISSSQTEYMVDMKCEGCVNAVKNKLQGVDGVKSVDVDLSNQVVRILGATPVKIMTEALEQTGRKARLIGQGVPEVIDLKNHCPIFADFLISAAVAEFKGPNIFGKYGIGQG